MNHRILTASEGDGIMVCQSFSPEADLPSVKTFLESYKKKFGNTDDIHEIAASSYDGVRLWAEGVKKAGTLDRMKVIEALGNRHRLHRSDRQGHYRSENASCDA